MDKKDVILEVKNLSTTFRTQRGNYKAVDGVDFHVKKGEILGIVGESGCGKSVTVQSVMRLYDEKRTAVYGGCALLEGENLFDLPFKDMRKIRGPKISMVFQDALSALNPLMKIGPQIVEAISIHGEKNKKSAYLKAVDILKAVGIPSPEKRFYQYPHELSGGMRQRVMIGIALACRPKLLIADEPTTALDVTIQAQILDLMKELNQEMDMGIILITHDLAVVSKTCERVLVMYLGQIVEEGEAGKLFACPSHPYTVSLMESIPHMEGDRGKRLNTIKGTVPLLSQIPSGCRFAPRCPRAREKCRENMPGLAEIGDGQKVRCWYPVKPGEDLV